MSVGRKFWSAGNEAGGDECQLFVEDLSAGEEGGSSSKSLNSMSVESNTPDLFVPVLSMPSSEEEEEEDGDDDDDDDDDDFTGSRRFCFPGLHTL